MSRLANEQAGQQLFSFTPSLTILTRISPWNGRGHWILWMIQQISTGALSAALSACCCACFPRLWAVPLSLLFLPLCPGGCNSIFQHVQWSSGHTSAPSGKPIHHLHTTPPGWALQTQGYSCTVWSVGGISLSSFVSEHELFWHDLMSIVEYRMEKVKIIHRVQQERKAYFLGSKTVSRAKHSNAPFTF